MSSFNNSISPVETRSVEESVGAALSLIGKAEHLLALLHAEVTGYRQTEEATANGVAGASGLMHDADRLAGRLEAFVADFDRTRARITSPNVRSLGAQGQNAAAHNYG